MITRGGNSGWFLALLFTCLTVCPSVAQSSEPREEGRGSTGALILVLVVFLLCVLGLFGAYIYYFRRIQKTYRNAPPNANLIEQQPPQKSPKGAQLKTEPKPVNKSKTQVKSPAGAKKTKDVPKKGVPVPAAAAVPITVLPQDQEQDEKGRGQKLEANKSHQQKPTKSPTSLPNVVRKVSTQEFIPGAGNLPSNIPDAELPDDEDQLHLIQELKSRDDF